MQYLSGSLPTQNIIRSATNAATNARSQFGAPPNPFATPVAVVSAARGQDGSPGPSSEANAANMWRKLTRWQSTPGSLHSDFSSQKLG